MTHRVLFEQQDSDAYRAALELANQFRRLSSVLPQALDDLSTPLRRASTKLIVRLAHALAERPGEEATLAWSRVARTATTCAVLLDVVKVVHRRPAVAERATAALDRIVAVIPRSEPEPPSPVTGCIAA